MTYFGFKPVYKAVKMAIKRLSEYIAVRISRKKGNDEELARNIGHIIGIVLILLLLGLAYEVEACTDYIRNGGEMTRLDKIDEAPLTVEMLGLSASTSPISLSKKEKNYTTLEYTATLSDGTYLKYTYDRYRDEASANSAWETTHKMMSHNVDYQFSDCDYAWYETNVDVGADNTGVVVYTHQEKALKSYFYYVQKETICMEIEYSGEALTESQLQVIADVLSSQ